MNETFALQKTYLRENYPHLLTSFTDFQLLQISWVDNTHKTNELATLDKPAKLDSIQQRRMFARLNCLHLLRSGNEETYTAFVQSQPEEIRLSKDHFAAVSNYIRALNEDEYKLLWFATTVSLSLTAKEEVNKYLNDKIAAVKDNDEQAKYTALKDRINATEDSVQWLAIVMSEIPEAYPAAREILHLPNARKILNNMFNTAHGRHLMYMEGGYGMLTQMKQKIAQGQFDQKAFDLWFNYWLIDITGFRGHIEAKGSVYLTEHTFRALESLRACLLELFTNPNARVLENYLNERGQWIGVASTASTAMWSQAGAEIGGVLILSRLAAMQRLFTPTDGARLQTDMADLKDQLGDDEYRKLIPTCHPFTHSDEPTSTFAPALFANLYSKSPQFMIKYGLPVFAKALQQYRQMRERGEIRKDMPLNFNGLANPESIERIIKGEMPEITIDPTNGRANFAAPRLEADKDVGATASTASMTLRK